jgi:predicted  nucleic acid-binding Zn-ribbon protein
MTYDEIVKVKPRGTAAFIRQLERQRDRLGKIRDTLREMQSECEALADKAEEAERALEAAIDSLSEYA